LAAFEGRTGYSGNAMLVAVDFTIFYTKRLKKGLLRVSRAFWIFFMKCRRGLLIRHRGLLIPVRPCRFPSLKFDERLLMKILFGFIRNELLKPQAIWNSTKSPYSMGCVPIHGSKPDKALTWIIPHFILLFNEFSFSLRLQSEQKKTNNIYYQKNAWWLSSWTFFSALHYYRSLFVVVVVIPLHGPGNKMCHTLFTLSIKHLSWFV
jgi:hypothetical protein